MADADQSTGDQREKPKSADLLEQYSGSAARMADKLAEVLDDNWKLRQKNRDLGDENGRLKTTQTPDGARVLTGDDAAAYDAYLTLGKPDEVKGKLDQLGTVQGELSTLKRDATVREVAELAGYKPNVLARLGAELEYVTKEVTADGKTERRPFVKTERGEQDLAEYAAAQWGDFLPALAARESQAPPPSGVRFPVQGHGERTPPSSPAADYLNRTYGKRTA